MMLTQDPILVLFTLIGVILMAFALFRGLGGSAVFYAQLLVDQRRAQEAKQREAAAAAEAAGHAAALEPLNLNADGTIEAPIIGVVETQ